jgi:hypothetical protein
VLKVELTNSGCVHGAEEMGGQHTALSGIGRGQVEVEDSRLTCSLLLNKTSVDNATRGRVAQLTVLISHEETLSDTLVHDDQSDLGLLIVFTIVHLDDGILELANFSL